MAKAGIDARLLVIAARTGFFQEESPASLGYASKNLAVVRTNARSWMLYK
jgi:hypothetical protein